MMISKNVCIDIKKKSSTKKIHFQRYIWILNLKYYTVTYLWSQHLLNSLLKRIIKYNFFYNMANFFQCDGFKF